MPPKAKGKAKAGVMRNPGAKAGAKAAAKGQGKGADMVAADNRLQRLLQQMQGLEYTINTIRTLVVEPGPLEGNRLQNLDQTLQDHANYVRGWQHRAQILYHLRSWTPAPENVEAWQRIREAAIARLEAATFPEISADGAVLLEFLISGYGASVAAAMVMQRDHWRALKNRVLARPDEEISNESLGGRTSDECTTNHALVNGAAEYDDPVRVAGFLSAFPDGAFGTPDFFAMLSNLST